MASGMEMLINSAIKAAGINPEELKEQARQAFAFFQQLTSDVSAIRDELPRMEYRLISTMRDELQASEARIISAIRGDVALEDDALVERFALPAPTAEDFNTTLNEVMKHGGG